MTEQTKTPAPDGPEPEAPAEETEPALEPADAAEEAPKEEAPSE